MLINYVYSVWLQLQYNLVDTDKLGPRLIRVSENPGYKENSIIQDKSALAYMK